ncbi:MAG TPA: hypothetical protein VK494_09445 [Gemmatimonadaceae bacterium]|nr:hypothetical protein [Gemmatimonadaceae bacterium]
MKLEATISSVVEDGQELSVTIRGWADSDPDGTYSRSLGTINIPATTRTRKSYYIGRRLFIDVRPA